MSTTHKATPYARHPDVDKAHELEFYFSDYSVSWSLGLEIAEALGEALTDLGEGDNLHLSEILHEVVDSVIPVYYSGILKEWQECGCPESDEYDLGPGIWQQMTAGLWGAMYDFASSVVHTDEDDIPSALERLNTIYPYKIT